MGYSFGVLILVIIGRAISYDWILAEWYTVHTKFTIIGMLWILLLNFIQNNKKSKIVLFSSIIYLLLSLGFGSLTHWVRAKNVRNYYLEKKIFSSKFYKRVTNR